MVILSTIDTQCHDVIRSLFECTLLIRIIKASLSDQDPPNIFGVYDPLQGGTRTGEKSPVRVFSIHGDGLRQMENIVEQIIFGVAP